MADTKQLARHFGQAAAQRQVVALVGTGNDLSARNTFGQHHRRNGVGVPALLFGAKLELPALGDRSAHAFGQVMVAGDNIVQTLFVDHLERLDQPVHQGQSRRVGEVAGGIALDHVGQIKVSPLQLGRWVHRKRLGAGAQNAQARRQHKAFLRTGNRHVDAPVIEAEL